VPDTTYAVCEHVHNDGEKANWMVRYRPDPPQQELVVYSCHEHAIDIFERYAGVVV
jgi:hypothetical protein